MQRLLSMHECVSAFIVYRRRRHCHDRGAAVTATRQCRKRDARRDPDRCAGRRLCGSAAAATRPQRGRAARHRARAVHRRHRVCPGRPHAAFVRAPVGARRRSARSTSRPPRKCRASSPSITGRDLAADGIGAIPPVALLPGRGRQADVRRSDAGARRRARPLRRRAGRDRGRRDGGTRRRTRPKPWRSSSTRCPPRRTSRARWRRTRRRSGRGAPGNVALDWEDGDAAAVDAAFARAAHVERVRLLDTRLAPSAMEPRAAIASCDAATGALHADRAGTQGVARGAQAPGRGACSRCRADRIRVVTYDVGGGFGMKVQALRGVRRAALRGAARRAAGQMVRHAGSRAFSPTPTAATGCSRASSRSTPTAKFLGAARADLVGHRRLHVDVRGDLRDRQHEELPVERVRHPGDPYRREDGAHQCGAARARIAAPGGRKRSI